MKKLLVVLAFAGMCAAQTVNNNTGSGGSGTLTCTAPTVVNQLLAASNTLGTVCNGVVLSGIPILTNGVPAASVATDISALWSGSGACLLARDGTCTTVSSAYTAITGVPSGAILGNSTNATAAAEAPPGLSYLIASNIRTLTVTAGSSQLANPPIAVLSNAGVRAAELRSDSGGSLGLGCGSDVGNLMISNANPYLKIWRCDGGAENTRGVAAQMFQVSASGVFSWSNSTSFPNGTTDTTLCRSAAGIVEAGSSTGCAASGTFLGVRLQAGEIAVGSLVTCNSGSAGSRQSVTDSNAASFTAGIGAVVAAGGSTHVPVYCDGTNWRIG